MDNRRTNEPTTKQAGIVAFIIGYRALNGQSPTEDEIASNFEIHRSAVQGQLARLIKKGILKRVATRFRNLRVTL